jgi:glycosyltransferase involved in cell wall biosynthesis
VVVAREDEAGLADAVARFAADPELVARMGLAARLHMKQRFAMDHIVSGYAARLSEVLQ